MTSTVSCQRQVHRRPVTYLGRVAAPPGSDQAAARRTDTCFVHPSASLSSWAGEPSRSVRPPREQINRVRARTRPVSGRNDRRRVKGDQSLTCSLPTHPTPISTPLSERPPTPPRNSSKATARANGARAHAHVLAHEYANNRAPPGSIYSGRDSGKMLQTSSE